MSELRRLVPSDAAALQALRLAALRECPAAFSSSFEEECGLPLSVIATHLAPDSGRYSFGAFAGSELAGIVGVGREAPNKLRHNGFIRGMYVGPAHRGQGLGRALMQHALDFAATMEGVRQVTLAATIGNDAAIGLYQSLGFKSYGHEPGALLIDGVLYDEVQMVRELGPVAQQAAPRKPVVLAPGQGRAYPMGQLSAVFKADEAETLSQYSVSEWWLKPYTEGPGAHMHPEDDLFYVIEGVMSISVGDTWFECEPGAFVLAPGGVAHDFANRSAARAGFLNFSAPGPFEPAMPGIAEWFIQNRRPAAR
ncbi:MAG: GNAT family N-acetyltransferase [Pseudomonadota bacterium]